MRLKSCPLKIFCTYAPTYTRVVDIFIIDQLIYNVMHDGNDEEDLA